MSAPVSVVRPADTDEVGVVTAVLASAFMRGDLAPWLVGSPQDRERIYPDYFAVLAEHAFDHGHVEITDDQLGVAIWYVHDGTNQGPIAGYQHRLALITAPYAARFRTLDLAMSRHHPDGEHHYLAFLAVHPDRQRRGYGSRLLRHHHNRLDTLGVPAYLEATSVRTRDFYVRHGYRCRLPFLVARDGPLLHPLWRDPVVAIPRI